MRWNRAKIRQRQKGRRIKNLSVYETVEMDKEYTTLNIKEVISDFNNIFKDVEKEKLSLELIVF